MIASEAIGCIVLERLDILTSLTYGHLLRFQECKNLALSSCSPQITFLNLILFVFTSESKDPPFNQWEFGSMYQLLSLSLESHYIKILGMQEHVNIWLLLCYSWWSGFLEIALKFLWGNQLFSKAEITCFLIHMHACMHTGTHTTIYKNLSTTCTEKFSTWFLTIYCLFHCCLNSDPLGFIAWILDSTPYPVHCDPQF